MSTDSDCMFIISCQTICLHFVNISVASSALPRKPVAGTSLQSTKGTCSPWIYVQGMQYSTIYYGLSNFAGSRLCVINKVGYK